LLKEVLTEHSSPIKLYNVDKTGIVLDGHAPRVITKKFQYRINGNKNQLMVIACVRASGQCIPLFVIFDANKLNIE